MDNTKYAEELWKVYQEGISQELPEKDLFIGLIDDCVKQVYTKTLESKPTDRTAIDKDKLNDNFRMIISHAYLGYDRVNDMGLNEFNAMLDNLVKAVADL